MNWPTLSHFTCGKTHIFFFEINKIKTGYKNPFPKKGFEQDNIYLQAIFKYNSRLIKIPLEIMQGLKYWKCCFFWE